jgi:hypothetical protein
MKFTGKTRLMAVGLSALLAVSVVGGVMAVGPGSGDNSSTPTTSTTTDAGGALRGHPRLRIAKGLLTSVADTIGIDVKALVKQMRSEHATIGTVASEHGVAPQTVIDNAVTKADAAIDQLVADGKLKPERAATIKENLPARITTIVNDGRHHRLATPAATPAPSNP